MHMPLKETNGQLTIEALMVNRSPPAEQHPPPCSRLGIAVTDPNLDMSSLGTRPKQTSPATLRADRLRC
jgi:hypothetical protein